MPKRTVWNKGKKCPQISKALKGLTLWNKGTIQLQTWKVDKEKIFQAWAEVKKGKNISKAFREIGYARPPKNLYKLIPKQEIRKYTLKRRPTILSPSTISKAKVKELFDEFINYQGTFKDFYIEKKLPKNSLRNLFIKYFPIKYEQYMELKRGLSYQQGYAFEYIVRNKYEEKGYYVLRSPASKGPVDAIALMDGEINLIQCKSYKGHFSKEEEEKLIKLANSINAQAILAYKNPKGEANFEKLNENKKGI